MNYEQAMALLRRYNSESFHLCHAITVSKVMRRMANELGYGDEADFWAVVGLLHDIDFEQWPDEHCKKCVELLRDGGADERLIHAVVCHGYGLCTDVAPEHEMEKVLFACDELTGLIGACAKMRPSGSITDMDLKSLKKKYKSKGFAAGCSREVIAQGAELLGWELDDLLSKTLEAMKPDEAAIIEELSAEYEGRVIIGKCDVDGNNDIVAQYRVRNIPTVLFIKNGELLDKLVGANPKSAFVEKIEKYL